MKVLFVDLYTTIRGTVKYVGPVSGLVGYRLGVEVDPDHDHGIIIIRVYYCR